MCNHISSVLCFTTCLFLQFFHVVMIYENVFLSLLKPVFLCIILTRFGRPAPQRSRLLAPRKDSALVKAKVSYSAEYLH